MEGLTDLSGHNPDQSAGAECRALEPRERIKLPTTCHGLTAISEIRYSNLGRRIDVSYALIGSEDLAESIAPGYRKGSSRTLAGTTIGGCSTRMAWSARSICGRQWRGHSGSMSGDAAAGIDLVHSPTANLRRRQLKENICYLKSGFERLKRAVG